MRYESIRLFFSAKVFRQVTFWYHFRSSGLARATFWRRCVPAGSSSDFLASLGASGAVKRLFGVAVCQRLRQATFWRRCVPAAPSSDFLASLRASESVKRLFGVAACQRLRHATFWGACVPAAPSCDILGSLCASGSVMRHFEAPACQRRGPSDRMDTPRREDKERLAWGACCIAIPPERGVKSMRMHPHGHILTQNTTSLSR